MQALFIGQTYIDVIFLTDRMPTGDERHVASAYAISFGGNAVTAAFCCAKLGIAPDVLATVADDRLGRIFLDMATRYGLTVHARKVGTSPLSFIMPNDGKGDLAREFKASTDNVNADTVRTRPFLRPSAAQLNR